MIERNECKELIGEYDVTRIVKHKEIGEKGTESLHTPSRPDERNLDFNITKEKSKNDKLERESSRLE